MKRFTIYFALFLLMFIISFTKVKSCSEQDYNMLIGNCWYKVTICVDCTVGPSPSVVEIRGFRLLDPMCEQNMTSDQILAQIESIVFTYDFIYTTLCDQLSIAPCSTLTHTYWRINHWVCWQMEWIDDAGQLNLFYHPCDYDNYCYEDCYFCWDPVYGFLKHCFSPTMVGSVTCTKEGYEVDEPEKELGATSECYIYHTPCNP